MLNIFEVYEKLAGAFGPSGRESEISSVIAEYAKPFADEIWNDTMGNLIVRKKGSGDKKIMMCAHMDSIGFVATFVDDNGFIRFSPIGGIVKSDILHIAVKFQNGTMGVISYDEKVPVKDLMMSDLFIDIGAASREDALSKISIGDFAVFTGKPFMQGDVMVGNYMDNRIGCTVLLCALSELSKTPNDLYFVFSSQEEIGLRGAVTSTYAIEPDIFIAVDVTDTGDMPERKYHNSVKLSKGAAIKILDRSVIANAEVRDLLETTAKKHNIPYQFEIMEYGGTDAGAAQKSRGGVLSGGIAIPTRYIHSPNEMVSLSDVQSAIELLKNSVSE